MERIKLANSRRQPRAVVLAAVAAGAAAGGCSSKQASAPLALPAAQVSGSRLRARFLAGPDGLRIPAGWMDSQFGGACSLASDGDRCLPDPVPAFGSSVPLYADATCTTPVVDVAPGCPAYYGDPLVFVVDQSVTPQRYATVISSVPAGTQAYTLAPDCIAAQTLTQGYVISPPLSDAAFAQFGAATPTGTGRLQLLYRHTEDGAQQLVGIHDSARAADCTPLTAGDGKLRCLPTDVSVVTNYADAACTRAAFSASNTAVRAVAVSVAYHLSCVSERVFALGDRRTESLSVLYALQNGVCTGMAITPEDFVVGDEIPPEMFEPLTVREVGAGRIHEQVLLDSGGAVVARSYGWRDTGIDDTVYPTIVEGPHWALLPADRGPLDVVAYFSDAACTRDELLVPSYPDECSQPPRYERTFDRSSGPTCEPTQAFSLGPPADLQQIYTDRGGFGTCAPAATLVMLPPGAALLPEGPAVDPSTFVAVTISSE